MSGRFDKTTGKMTYEAGKSGTIDLVIETASLTTGDNERGTRPRSRDEVKLSGMVEAFRD
jgi:polyisoprenoid-binding protein YceI